MQEVRSFSPQQIAKRLKIKRFNAHNNESVSAFLKRALIMAEWYYRSDTGRETGPLPSSKLLELIRSGHVTSETMVRKDNSAWFRACEVNGLWKAVNLPDVLFECPHCQSSIEKPPCRCANCNQPVSKAVGKLVKHKPTQDKGWTSFQRKQKESNFPPIQ